MMMVMMMKSLDKDSTWTTNQNRQAGESVQHSSWGGYLKIQQSNNNNKMKNEMKRKKKTNFGIYQVKTEQKYQRVTEKTLSV